MIFAQLQELPIVLEGNVEGKVVSLLGFQQTTGTVDKLYIYNNAIFAFRATLFISTDRSRYSIFSNETSS